MDKIDENYKSMSNTQIHAESISLRQARKLAKDNSHGDIIELDLSFIALECESMFRNNGKFPRDTQILNVLNVLIQIGHIINETSTGEGKGLISALISAYLVYTGQTVDILTSDQKLSRRDLEEFSSFYESLAISVGSSTITAGSKVEDYTRDGVNYSVAADIALFRATREFYSHTSDPYFNTAISIV
jgi:preprotein translocase subunit SecA